MDFGFFVGVCLVDYFGCDALISFVAYLVAVEVVYFGCFVVWWVSFTWKL